MSLLLREAGETFLLYADAAPANFEAAMRLYVVDPFVRRWSAPFDPRTILALCDCSRGT
jgi:hypothetical protein